MREPDYEVPRKNQDALAWETTSKEETKEIIDYLVENNFYFEYRPTVPRENTISVSKEKWTGLD